MLPTGELKTLWRGIVRGVQWNLILRDVYEGPVVDPVEGDPIPGSHKILWNVTLSGSDGHEQQGWWDPQGRILGVSLEGWSHSAIGELKRHLIRLGQRP